MSRRRRGQSEVPEDGDSNEMDGRRGWKDSATNSAADNLKCVVMRPLAEDDASQHQWYERTKTDVPGPPLDK